MNASYRNRSKPRSYRLASDKRLLLDALLVAVPAFGFLAWFLVSSNESDLSRGVIAAITIVWVLFAAQRVRAHFVYHLRTLSTLVEAIRREDFSLRSSRHREPGALGELYQQINHLADHLQYTEQQEQELRGLLGKIISRIDVAILAIDHRGEICLANPRAAELAATDAVSLLGRQFGESVFGVFEFGDESTLVEWEFPGAIGRWQVAWQEYRQEAKPGQLLFITDLKQLLNQQEVKAWQGLIRVITHEINNSLTPISSISQTLASRLASNQVDQGDSDFIQGLELISQRSNDLTRFIAEYARLARLPQPQPQVFSMVRLLEDVAALYPGRIDLLIDAGQKMGQQWNGEVTADPVQIEQVLINLVKNALEASEDSAENIELSLERGEDRVVVQVSDRGCGLANPANLFIPFYTTKSKGSGIGLPLCRQIAESHDGQLKVENRDDGKGVVATLVMPLEMEV